VFDTPKKKGASRSDSIKLSSTKEAGQFGDIAHNPVKISPASMVMTKYGVHGAPNFRQKNTPVRCSSERKGRLRQAPSPEAADGRQPKSQRR